MLPCACPRVSSQVFTWKYFRPLGIVDQKASADHRGVYILAHAATASGLPWWLTVKAACNAENAGSIPGLGRSPGEGNGNSLQYSCLENPMDRGVWQATVHGSQRVGHN